MTLNSGPLSGVRVIDLTAVISGPLATQILGDQGADVIKVEPPGIGDLTRPMGTSRGGLSAIYAAANRNKRSLVLDLSQPEGLEVFAELVATADVLVQNFRPGAAERMGIGYDAMRGYQGRPRLRLDQRLRQVWPSQRSPRLRPADPGSEWHGLGAGSGWRRCDRTGG